VRGSILLVGLDESRRDRVSAAVPAGFQVVAVDRADQALEAMARALPAAVVVDFPVPLRDGRLLTAVLKADPATAGVPVLAYTAWNYRRTRAAALSAGCAAVLGADASAHEVSAALGELLLGAAAYAAR
jgi:two-component system, cell cycle response regulator DivK